ncbi:branched-chain-amino-acid aminotransferase 5 [Rhexocercosporidium sp. MPI-PUGE-AT-0058]|nr:branched-chain-amino-acid aminotransferase 5 [Rhexocercosporidium sp. MPI-PUGE-AT-0058]
MSGFPPLPTDAIDWKSTENIQLHEVNGHIESTYHKESGQWTPLKFVSDPHLNIHGLSPGLNYGQQAFEGLKACRTPEMPGKITIFRPERNALRLQHSANLINLPSVPVDMFLQACRAAVALNAEYVPPHESGQGMYIRPLLFASSPMFFPGLPERCTFCVYVFPTSVGAPPTRATKALILDDFDRAPPKGLGNAKVGGNYAGVVRWTGQAHAEGFGITLHLDSVRHEEIDEFSTCGFLGVLYPENDANDVTIVLPDSPSVIDSITSDSVQHIARSWGWKVEKRPIPYTKLASFNEVLGAGTAVGLVPIRSITRKYKSFPAAAQSNTRSLAHAAGFETVSYMPDEQQGGGPVHSKLIAELRAIQLGIVADKFGWRCEVEEKDKLLDASAPNAAVVPMPVF